MAQAIDSYTVPRASATEDTRLGWLRDAMAEGNKFLHSQPAWKDIRKGRDIVESLVTYDEDIPDKLSHVRSPRLKRQIKEIVATMSNIRPTWDYISNDKEKYDSQANVLNKLHEAWYSNTFADRKIRKALQYAAVEGTGYLYTTWERKRGHGEIRLAAGGAESYIPVQQGSSNDIQDCYDGIWKTEIPIDAARKLYPEFATRLFPTNEHATYLSRAAEIATTMLSPFLAASGPRKQKEQRNVPTVDIYHHYIDDDAINLTDRVIPMGEPGTSWHYEVPYVGKDIRTGLRRATQEDGQPKYDLTGEPAYEDITRPATYEDCKLYPNRRLIIVAGNVIVYDGPSMWWHGKIPVVQFRFDDWPWLFLGFSLVRDTWRLEESNNAKLRALDDVDNARLNPALMIDDNMSDEFQGNISPRVPGLRVKKPRMVDSPVEPLLPPAYYQLSTGVSQDIKDNEERLDYLLGVGAVQQIMALKQMPTAEGLEKVLQAAGPLVTDYGRNMEASIRDLGEMWKALAFQWKTLPERLRLVGQDGVTKEDFDFDPGNMIPSHLLEEDSSQPSRASKIERAKYHLRSFTFNVVPNSLA